MNKDIKNIIGKNINDRYMSMDIFYFIRLFF